MLLGMRKGRGTWQCERVVMVAVCMHQMSLPAPASPALLQAVAQSLRNVRQRQAAAAAQRLKLLARVNRLRCQRWPLFGTDTRRAVHVELPVHHVHLIREQVGGP
jgi:hypothetical protein